MNKKCVYLRPCTKALYQQKSLCTYLTRPFIPITLIAPLQLSLFLCHIKRIYIHNVFPYFLFIFSRMRPVFINNFLFKHNKHKIRMAHKRKLFNNKNTTENSTKFVYTHYVYVYI